MQPLTIADVASKPISQSWKRECDMMEAVRITPGFIVRRRWRRAWFLCRLSIDLPEFDIISFYNALSEEDHYARRDGEHGSDDHRNAPNGSQP